MTISEMHTAFKLELDKTSALELPAFEPEEVDFWLNLAIRRFVKNRFLGENQSGGFEESLKRLEDLKTLVLEEDLTGVNLVASTIKPNSYLADTTALTYEKWFIVGEEVEISFTTLETGNTTTKRQGVIQCNSNTYRAHIDDPYSEHFLHYEEARPLRLVYQDYVELVTDGNYTITDYYIRYLRKPIAVSLLLAVDCDLPEHTHDEVVALSVSMALENIEQPRYQSYLNELNKVE